jgi:putative ABC transport system ATP-binding protein
MALVEVKNVSKIYGFGSATTVALDNVSLSIEAGEFLAIMGPSGSGKSTLMHLIGLLDQPTHGDLMIDGQDMATLSSKQLALLRRKKLGFVFQSFNLLPRLTAIENVALPLTYSDLSHVKQLKRAETMLSKVGLADRQYYMPAQLSGGQVQRVAIARALINNPMLILADEPTGNLDSVSGLSVMDLLQDLNKQGHTIIIVTHDAKVATYAKRVVKMIDGRIDTDSSEPISSEAAKSAPAKAKKVSAKSKTKHKTAKRKKK